VGGYIVEIVIEFFYVFTVIAFPVPETEQPFFQKGVFAIPKAYGEAEVLEHVGNACEAVFAPYVCPESGVVERKVVPGITVGAIIFAYGAPLAFAKIRSPFFKRYGFSGVFR
jgi:hypothetical protein